MTFDLLLQAIRVHWRVVVSSGLLAIVAGSLFLLLQKPTYSAESSVVVASRYGSSSSELFQGASYSQIAAQNLSELVQTPTVLDVAARKVGVSNSHVLADRVTAVVPDGRAVIQLRATGTTAQDAVDLVNGVAAGLQRALLAVQPSGSSPVQNVILSDVDPAQDAVYLSPSPIIVILGAAAFGLILGYSIAVLLLSGAPRLMRGSGASSLEIGAGAGVDVAVIPRGRATPVDPDGWSFAALRLLALGRREETPVSAIVIRGVGVAPGERTAGLESALRSLGPTYGLHLPSSSLPSDAPRRRQSYSSPGKHEVPGGRPTRVARSSAPEARAPKVVEADALQTSSRSLVDSTERQRPANFFLDYAQASGPDLPSYLRTEAPSMVIFIGAANRTRVSDARSIVELCALVGVGHCAIVIA